MKSLINKYISIKKTLTDFSEFRKVRMSLEQLSELYSANNSNTSQTHFLTPQASYISTARESIGLTDIAVSPKDIFEMLERDTYVSGLYDQFVEALFEKSWYITGGKMAAKSLSDKLKSIGIDKLLKKRISAKWAEGGGNYLFFTTKKNGQLQMKLFPFLSNGRPKIRVYGDNNLEEIVKYEVLGSNGEILFTLDPAKSYVEHGRYSERGDYRFSSNPAKKAVFWYILKKYIAGANLSGYQNGMQDPVILSLDYDGLAKLATAFNDSQNKVGGDVSSLSARFTQDPFKFFKEQSELTREIFRSELVGATNANKAIMTKVPVTVTRVGRDNKSMETIPLISVCNEEMGFALRMSKGILSTKESKYNNAEVETDNFGKLVLDPEKRDCEEWVMQWVLPILDPTFNPEKNKFRFGRDPDAEDLEVYNAKTERITKEAEIIKTLVGTGYKYDIENAEIVKGEEFPQSTTPPAPTPEPSQTKNQDTVQAKSEKETDNLVDENTDTQAVRKAAAKKTLRLEDPGQYLRSMVDDAIESANYRKFEKLIKKASVSQLEFYTKRLAERETLEDAIAHINDDLPALSSSGLPVNTLRGQLLKFAKIGVEEFNETHGEKTRAKVEELDYPQEVLDLIDTKSQFLLKGVDSLDDDQKSFMSKYFSRYKNYQGLDADMSSEINTILSRNLSAGLGVEQAVQDILASTDKLSEFRAFRIAQTETAQAIEVTRFELYTANGYIWKKRVTVGDKRVRKAHRNDAKQGWIEAGSAYKSGEMGPQDAVLCRCVNRYSDAEEKPSKYF